MPNLKRAPTHCDGLLPGRGGGGFARGNVRGAVGGAGGARDSRRFLWRHGTKCDLIDNSRRRFLKTEYPQSILASALNGQGFNKLLNSFSNHLAKQDVRLQIDLSYQDQKALDFVYKNGQVFDANYQPQSITVDARLPNRHIKKLTTMLCHSTYNRSSKTN